GLVELAKLETELWSGQCNDNLKRIRLMLGKKAFLEALVSLGASKEMLDQFQILDQSHLKMSTKLINPKESGWKHDSLPWFWYMDVEGDSLSSNYMKECEWIKD
ncbi:hypothetical protein L208DRAFT_1344975, partial [Tricholoma matsutake]